MNERFCGVDVELTRGLVQCATPYGARVVFEDEKGLAHILSGNPKVLADLTKEYRALILGVQAPTGFSMRGRYGGKRTNFMPEITLPFHVDLDVLKRTSTTFQNSSEEPDSWTHGIRLFWQNRREIGRVASTLAAPPAEVQSAMQFLFLEPDEIFEKLELNNQEIISDIDYLLRYFAFYLKKAPRTATARVMAFRDLFFEIYYSDDFAKYRPLITKMNDYIISQCQSSTLEVDWTREEFRNGAVLCLDDGDEGATEKPLAHSRRNHNPQVPVNNRSVFDRGLSLTLD